MLDNSKQPKFILTAITIFLTSINIVTRNPNLDEWSSIESNSNVSLRDNITQRDTSIKIQADKWKSRTPKKIKQTYNAVVSLSDKRKMNKEIHPIKFTYTKQSKRRTKI